ncbi:MAG: spermidine synthase, partial [Lachnospiraceae bacterium]|nr:spermidine synthase [Lachnospiraceae bacterium]
MIFAGILLALSIVYFVSSKVNFSKAKKVPVSVVLFLVCCILGHDGSFAFWQTDLTYEGESIYNYLQVYETPSQVVLSTNVLFGTQSVYRKEKGPTGMYYDYAMAALPMADTSVGNPTKILVLGNGSGT